MLMQLLSNRQKVSDSVNDKGRAGGAADKRTITIIPQQPDKSILATVDDEYAFEYWLELENQWKEQQSRLTDKELLEIFPEAKTILSSKIQEWRERRAVEATVIRRKIQTIKQESPPQDLWFWLAIIKCLDMPSLLAIDKQLARLKRLQNLAQNKPTPKGWITQEQIAQARTASTADFASQYIKLRKRGRTLVGLCPLHKERTPSFTIFLNDNRWYCFGCNHSGDIINLVRELQGLSFLEAVRYLLNL